MNTAGANSYAFQYPLRSSSSSSSSSPGVLLPGAGVCSSPPFGSVSPVHVGSVPALGDDDWEPIGNINNQGTPVQQFSTPPHSPHDQDPVLPTPSSLGILEILNKVTTSTLGRSIFSTQLAPSHHHVMEDNASPLSYEPSSALSRGSSGSSSSDGAHSATQSLPLTPPGDREYKESHSHTPAMTPFVWTPELPRLVLPEQWKGDIGKKRLAEVHLSFYC